MLTPSCQHSQSLNTCRAQVQVQAANTLRVSTLSESQHSLSLNTCQAQVQVQAATL